MDALQALTTRASPSQLAEPAPDDIAVEAMLRAAANAPDHARLCTSRFIVVSGEARFALGEVLATALRKRDPNAPEAMVDKERSKPLRAPLIIIVAAHLRDHRNVPAIEQIISAGAAAQNILLAAHALGFGGFWRTGAIGSGFLLGTGDFVSQPFFALLTWLLADGVLGVEHDAGDGEIVAARFDEPLQRCPFRSAAI